MASIEGKNKNKWLKSKIARVSFQLTVRQWLQMHRLRHISMSRLVNSTRNDRTGSIFLGPAFALLELINVKWTKYSVLLTTVTAAMVSGSCFGCVPCAAAQQHSKMQLEMVWNLNVIVCFGTCQSHKCTVNTHTSQHTMWMWLRLWSSPECRKLPVEEQMAYGWQRSGYTDVHTQTARKRNKTCENCLNIRKMANGKICFRNSSAQFPLHVCLVSRNWKINNTQKW